MPHFEQNPLEKLALQPGEVDGEIDLRGFSLGPALARLSRLIDQENGSAKRYAIRFDPPRGDGMRTLFQPVGRFLLQARRNHRLARCLPLADGSGFYIALPAATQPAPQSSGKG